MRDYVGQHYTYDARGNLLERLDNGKKARFTWDLYDRLTRYEDDRLTADFAYDALGRRVAKYSKAHCQPSAGPARPGVDRAATAHTQRPIRLRPKHLRLGRRHPRL
ncbi:hypothetical protein [Pseudomonas sp. HY2-MNA-CIBAN-0224]|uniref:hypothetical protein n=1 Tax=Pseudomonas sp. HY2-MNA-CIBAN-0224 TaxID=3140471 RepID=UPI00332AEC93